MWSRRDVLRLSGLAAVGLLPAARGAAPETGVAVPSDAPPDVRLEIVSATVQISPRHALRTATYNGQVPGPLLRLKEGRTVTVEIANRTDEPDVVHWHGLYLPVSVDGALEEGTPAIAPHSTVRLTFVPRPAGFRWYHTHTTAMGDLTRAQYGGRHGPLLIEARNEPGRYDRELFLTLHDWLGYLTMSDDGTLNPRYAVSTINGKTLGFGEPLRVKRGERVLMHVLNSSPTEIHWLALAGHRFQVIALDGNTTPTPRVVPMLRLAPAERVCALVQMDRPGNWILGEVRKHVRAAGMGIVLEYADASGEPRWDQPSDLLWGYEPFAADSPATAPPAPVHPIDLVFESKFQGHGAMERWLINGRSYPATGIEPLIEGTRYRLRFINRSGDDHPVHLHRHNFELRRLGVPLEAEKPGAPEIRGIYKDVLLVPAGTRSEVEFTADHPGPTLFHCHQQNHMDLGFMMVINYA